MSLCRRYRRRLARLARLARRGVLGAAVAGLTLGGCALVREGVEDQGPTLAELQPAELPQDRAEVPEVSLAEIEQSYRAALAVAADPQLRHRIQVRLADIEMARSENEQLAAQQEREHFDEAIALYDELSALDQTQRDAITDERLLYRLSKAYALDGRMAESTEALERLIARYPESAYAAEAYFRRAERAFSLGEYDRAQQLYAQVLSFGEATPFHLNAQYMHGWSLFKDSRFRASIASFTRVLDALLPQRESLGGLNDSQQNLVDDTLRVMSLTFTYLDGAESITEIYANLGERPYMPLLYRRLGAFHLDNERYTAAAEVYEHYLAHTPEADQGPAFTVELMDVYRQSGQADKVLATKERFVARYGVHSGYWAQRPPEQRHDLVVPKLAVYLDELSSHYHAEAQAKRAARQAYEKALAAGEKPGPKPESAAPDFLKAAEYYQQFLQAFPEHERRGDMTYLMAEAFYEAGQWERAVEAYERVAFEYFDPEHGADAGYNAVLVLEELKQQAPPEAEADWQARKNSAAITFADYYPGDPRAAPVLTQTAQMLFNRGDNPEQAVQIAQRITAWTPPPEPALLKTAWLILAHSQFDAGDYETAEQSYRQVLARLPEQSEERPAVVERIAASMYQAAEQLAAEGDKPAAVERLLAIEGSAPGTDIAIKAQYDAGNYMMELEQWARAEGVFTDFRQRYPEHALTATLPPKLAVIYQEMEAWDAAAEVLAQMANNQSDPQMRRQSRYLAAELYQKSGRPQAAAEQYSRYVSNYPQPFDLATEARFQLVQLAEQRGDERSRKQWLQALIDAHQRAGEQATDRSRYLAAYAANEFAAEAFARFERIKLTLPIKKSLKAKKAALDETLAAYKNVLNYGVAEFATEANYRIGNVYAQLSRDLLDSERPQGLEPLAMQQYEILLEEQAYPFEEKSVALLENNAQRAWQGFYDQWVKRSFKELAKLLPARYGKQETRVEVSDGLH